MHNYICIIYVKESHAAHVSAVMPLHPPAPYKNRKFNYRYVMWPDEYDLCLSSSQPGDLG